MFLNTKNLCLDTLFLEEDENGDPCVYRVVQTRADMQARACGQCKVSQRASWARVVPGQCQARPREVGSAAGWRAQGTSFAASAHHRKVRVRVAGHDRVRYARMRTHQRGTEGRGVFIKSSHVSAKNKNS